MSIVRTLEPDKTVVLLHRSGALVERGGGYPLVA